MESLDEKTSFDEKYHQRGFKRFSKTVKIVIIGVLSLFLLIPMVMIQELIRERGWTQKEAIKEVSEKWSREQVVTGPYINFQYPDVVEEEGKSKTIMRSLTLLPDELSVDGELKTEVLKRGSYEVNVYQSELLIKGSFSSNELLKNKIDISRLYPESAAICLNLSDMRGISQQIEIQLGDSVYSFEPGMDGKGIKEVGVHAMVNLSALKANEVIPYKLKLNLKGSESIFFVPLGKTSHVTLRADWNSPSFSGNFLPINREVTETDFTAEWQVLNLNRNYSQVLSSHNQMYINDINDSSFGVNLKIPVEQYQQTMRSAKYAILIILLTFGVIFFTEIVEKARIHALQYLLVGLALCLFYSLLLSFAEHLGFNLAYLLSSVLTIALVSGYMIGVIKKKKPAFIMAGLLAILYLYVFTLIQLETFALLVGSLGLFVILAIVMYFSKKIDWFTE